MELKELNRKKYYIILAINGEEKRFDLINTLEKHLKVFYLGYYTEPMFINVKTKEINENLFML